MFSVDALHRENSECAISFLQRDDPAIMTIDLFPDCKGLGFTEEVSPGHGQIAQVSIPCHRAENVVLVFRRNP
jgi:hypothetical protein